VTLELISTRVHPDDLQSLDDMINRARVAASDFEYEHRLLMPDHSVKYLHLIAHAVRDGHDRLEYIGAVQDVTERRLSEATLSKVRSRPCARWQGHEPWGVDGVDAHEVNQPLSGIIANAGTCLRMLNAGSPKRRWRA